MPAGGKGFFDRTWADTFDQSRDVNNDSTPVNLPYGKHVMEIEGRGGRGEANVINPAYQVSTNYPLIVFSQAAYTVSTAAYNVTTAYPIRYSSAAAYETVTNYPTRVATPTGPNAAYSVYADHPARYTTSRPAYETVYSYPAGYQTNYYLQPSSVYYEPQSFSYQDYPARYAVEPAYATYNKQPAQWTYEAAYESSETVYTQYVLWANPGFGFSPISYPTSSSAVQYTDYPASWTLTTASWTATNYPARNVLDEPSYEGVYVQPATSYTEPANYLVAYYLYQAAAYYQDYPARYTTQHAAYESVTTYPSRFQYQPAYSVYSDHPSRWTSTAAYTVQTNYPSRFNSYPSRAFYSGGYTVQTNYPARYYSGRSGEDTVVYLQAVDGTTYMFKAYGSTTPAMGTYTEPATPQPQYAKVDSPLTRGVYQSSVQASVGWSRNNALASEKGYINIRYDADTASHEEDV